MADTDSIDDQDILARTIWGEARGEGATGMHAVANVITNRVNNPKWWGNSFRSVCLYPYQFSCWNKNDPNRAKILAVTNYDVNYFDAVNIATAAINGNLSDITNGALNYYAKGSPMPVWAENATPCAEIGNHIFFGEV
jgi:N-acetylmuramoyl-L-alanine amidase